LAALVSVPLALIWALLFAIVTLFNVWLITPTLKLFAIVMSIIKYVWTELNATFIEPVCHALGACCARREMVVAGITRTQTAEAVPI